MVTHTVLSRQQRDTIRSLLPPRLVFVVLTMDKQLHKKRLEDRAADYSSYLTSWLAAPLKTAVPGEPNTVNTRMHLTPAITPEILADYIIASLAKITELGTTDHKKHVSHSLR